MAVSEEYLNYLEEFKEKYKEHINALSKKYDKDVGVAFDMLKAIAFALTINEKPLYECDVEYDETELVEDYKMLEDLRAKSIIG